MAGRAGLPVSEYPAPRWHDAARRPIFGFDLINQVLRLDGREYGVSDVYEAAQLARHVLRLLGSGGPGDTRLPAALGTTTRLVLTRLPSRLHLWYFRLVSGIGARRARLPMETLPS
jgi:hypothetical protein